jgi:Rrf2 family protein
MISTKGRYSLRILLDLAQHRNGSFIPMKDVAKRQGISLKYIERLLPALKDGGLIDSLHGKGGGYKLTREPDAYTLWEILNLAEGDLAPVECLKEDGEQCARSAQCLTLPVWQNYYKLIKDYFSGITLADLLKTDVTYDYII